MLVLTRRIGESIIISENIRVKVLNFSGEQIRIGVDAPENISIHRQEIFERFRGQESYKDLKAKAS